MKISANRAPPSPSTLRLGEAPLPPHIPSSVFEPAAAKTMVRLTAAAPAEPPRVQLLEATLKDLEAVLALARGGHPVFAAILDALEHLPAKLRYELARRDPAALTPFVKEALDTARSRLAELDWSMLGNSDHGLAEDLAWDLRALVGAAAR